MFFVNQLFLISLAIWLDLLWDSCCTCRYTTMEELGIEVVSHNASEPAAPEPCSSAPRKQWGIAAGGSLLGDSVSCLPTGPRQDCSLLVAPIWDVVDKLLRLVWPLYLLQFFYLGTIHTARRYLQYIKHECMSLGVRAKDKRAQVVFTSFLSVKGNCLKRNGWILWVKNWLLLCNSYQQQGFSFHTSEDQGLLGRDLSHQVRWKHFANFLALSSPARPA